MTSRFPRNFLILLFAVFLLASSSIGARQLIRIEPQDGDMTQVVRTALEGVVEKDVKLVLSKGRYSFRPDYATEKYCVITNHGNGSKKVIFPISGLDSIEIEGNGAELIFHGQVAPFQIDRCAQVTVTGLTVDWDIPFTFSAEVIAVNPEEGWRDVKPQTDGFSWKLQNDRLLFPNIDGFNYTELGSTLAFDTREKRVVDGALDIESHPRWVEKRKDGVLRIHEPLKAYPPVGSMLVSKGDREHDRYAPAFQVRNSKNVRFDGVVVHHALGMGFLFERTEDIALLNSGVYLREGSSRMISSTADATHFCNCKGQILIENCRFENMLDDATNVHGTYVEVNKVLDSKTVRVELKHFEQSGFEFAAAGDLVWFIHQPDPRRASENAVASVRIVNGRFIDLTFADPLPGKLAKGDVLENKTWNPSFTLRGSVARNHRARNIVLKSPLKTVIENNDFSSMMSSIFFRGETYFWFESGNVEDVLISNNRFKHCAYSQMEHAVVTVTPRLGAAFDSTIPYDRNIRFENNVIETFDNRIIWADRVDGLIIKGNTITQTRDAKPMRPDAHLFDFKNSRNVTVSGNTYIGTHKKAILADEATKGSLTVDGNKGF